MHAHREAVGGGGRWREMTCLHEEAEADEETHRLQTALAGFARGGGGVGAHGRWSGARQ